MSDDELEYWRNRTINEPGFKEEYKRLFYPQYSVEDAIAVIELYCEARISANEQYQKILRLQDQLTKAISFIEKFGTQEHIDESEKKLIDTQFKLLRALDTINQQ